MYKRVAFFCRVAGCVCFIVIIHIFRICKPVVTERSNLFVFKSFAAVLAYCQFMTVAFACSGNRFRNSCGVLLLNIILFEFFVRYKLCCFFIGILLAASTFIIISLQTGCFACCLNGCVLCELFANMVIGINNYVACCMTVFTLSCCFSCFVCFGIGLFINSNNPFVFCLCAVCFFFFSANGTCANLSCCFSASNISFFPFAPCVSCFYSKLFVCVKRIANVLSAAYNAFFVRLNAVFFTCSGNFCNHLEL